VGDRRPGAGGGPDVELRVDRSHGFLAYHLNRPYFRNGLPTRPSTVVWAGSPLQQLCLKTLRLWPAVGHKPDGPPQQKGGVVMTRVDRPRRRGEVCLCLALPAGLAFLILWGASYLLNQQSQPPSPNTPPPLWLQVK
jgi:hypothetical protein